MESQLLDGKVAIQTGEAGGIGRGAAELLSVYTAVASAWPVTK